MQLYVLSVIARSHLELPAHSLASTVGRTDPPLSHRVGKEVKDVKFKVTLLPLAQCEGLLCISLSQTISELYMFSAWGHSHTFLSDTCPSKCLSFCTHFVLPANLLVPVHTVTVIIYFCLPGQLLLYLYGLAGVKLDPEAHCVGLLSC